MPVVPHGPPVRVSGSVALFNLQSFAGGRDGGEWDFDAGPQFRIGVERDIRYDMTLGLAASYIRLPLFVSGGRCNGCAADASLWQGMATLRLGHPDFRGFSSAFEFSGGVTGFASFAREEDASPVQGEPTESFRDIVAAVAASYVLGYGIWQGFDVSLVQEVGILFYDTAPEAPSSTSIPRFTATRVHLRYVLPRRR